MARLVPGPIQQYRGTTAQHAAYTGKVGELTVDTDKKVVVVHDGSTAGGIPMAREDRKVTGDTHLKVNGSTEGTLAGDVTLTLDMTSVATDLVSTDANNGLSVGSDSKLYAKAPDANLIIRAGDKILHDADGKVAADLSMTYDQPSGKLKLIGHDGSTEVANVTIPSSTSVLKGVELTNGKPDAGGETVEGDYHLTLIFRDQNGVWSDAVGVQVTTTKGSAGTAEYSTELAEGGTSVAAVRAVFNGDDKTAEGGSSPATVTFDDTSSASVPFAVSGTTVSGTVSFTPQVGLKSGVYLHFIWALSDGSVADTYVDVTDLVDVYTAGQGITIDGHTISAKLGTGIKFDESGNIVVDFTNTISSDADNAIKAGADGKLSVKVVSTDGGNLIKTGTDKGALLTEADITDLVKNIVNGVVGNPDGSLGCSMMPIGGILPFSGTFGGEGNRFPIPLGSSEPLLSFCLCDGTTTNGLPVPDLRGRMILGASETYQAGSTGGSETHTHAIHSQVGSTTLSVEQMPSHNHQLYPEVRTSAGEVVFGRFEGGGDMGFINATHYTGGSQPHTHSLDVLTKTASSLPPYYVFAYIMRVA